MKKFLFSILTLTTTIIGCNSKDETKSGDTTSSTISLPYKASYTSDFSDKVSDSALLLVLNSYKYWESGDLKSLRGTMGDSMSVDGNDKFHFNGLSDSLMHPWTISRDSLSSVVITMDAWVKIHSNKDSADFINAWYKEIDTYKTGKVDSANYSDVNQVKNGKLRWYSSFKQKL